MVTTCENAQCPCLCGLMTLVLNDDSLRVDGSVVLPLYDNVSGVPHNGPSWMGQKKRASLS